MPDDVEDVEDLEAQDLAEGLMDDLFFAEEEPPSKPGESPLDWAWFSSNKKAAVLDTEGLTRGTCTCMVHENERYCFTTAAIGVLDPEQTQLCGLQEVQAMSPQAERLLQAALGCKGKLGQWLECAIEKGVKV